METSPAASLGTGAWAPYLSVVVTSRNDDHGGRLVERTQAFIDGLEEQVERHRLDTELVIVEWNPPPDKPRMSWLFRWPNGDSKLRVRIIEVPHEIHASYEHSDVLPIFQMIAKNVGIARARGDFVLATNVDLLFSDELMAFLASKPLLRGYYYRADRLDVPAVIPRGKIDDKLTYCRANVLRINKQEASYDLRTGETFWIYPPHAGTEDQRHNPLGWGAIGVLGFAFWYGEHTRELGIPRVRLRYYRGLRTQRQPRGTVGRIHVLSKIRQNAPSPFKKIWPASILDAKIKRTLSRRRVTPAPRRPGSGQPLRVVLRNGVQLAVTQVPRRPLLKMRLDTNASGDFTLMSREDWILLRGYPEFQSFSMHIDSLLLYQAYYSGIGEIILPFPTYHMEHRAGWGLAAEQTSLTDSLDSRGIPYVSFPGFLQLVKRLAESKGETRFNSGNWGLMDQQLVEINPVAGQINAVSQP